MSTQKAITEAVHGGQQFTVDESNPEFLVIRGVRVMNERSRNGGVYEAKAIQSASRLVNRLPLAIEHTGQGGRRYVDRVGQLRDGRVIEGGKAVEADAWINKGDPIAEKLRIDAKHFPENVNLSIELPADGWIGEDRRNVDGTYRVKEITRMDDCSIVARGGTTSTLYESYRPAKDDKVMSDTTQTAVVKEAVRNELQEAEARKAAIAEREKLDKELADSRAQVAKLQEELDAIKAAEAKRTRIAGLIKTAKELGSEITEAYAETLLPLTDEAAKAIFEREANLLKNAPQGGIGEDLNHQPPSLSGAPPVAGAWSFVAKLGA